MLSVVYLTGSNIGVVLVCVSQSVHYVLSQWREPAKLQYQVSGINAREYKSRQSATHGSTEEHLQLPPGGQLMTSS
jgi:hypothetical protein